MAVADPVAGGFVSRYPAPAAEIGPDRSRSWLARALPVLNAHRLTLATALGTSFLALLLQVQIPNLLNDAVSRSLERHDVALSHYVWWVLALALASGVFGFVSRRFLLRTAYAVEFDLRNLLYEHLTRMDFGFYDRVQSGQLISRANSDIRSVQMYLTMGPNIVVQCGIAVVAFVYMLLINVPLACVAMVAMPFVFVLSLRMRRRMFPVSWLIQSRLAEVATVVDENVNGVRVVKSFSAEQRELESLARQADRLAWAYVKDADLRARFTPAVQNLSQLGMALVLLVGGILVIHGHVGVGAILAFSAYIVMLQAPFQMLGMLVMLGQRAAASAQRIYEVLDEHSTVLERPDARTLDAVRGEVTFEHVDFHYGADAQDGTGARAPAADSPLGAAVAGPPVLADFSLALAPGETVAMVGRTASGKTTVSRLLSRFYDVTGGRITLDGEDLRDLTLASVRSHVGVVLDEPFLFSISVADNIAYGRPGADREAIRAAAVAAGADAFITALPEGYDTIVGERGYTLSGGQRQRVAIARTLLVNPPVLVLDDATSAVDVQVEQTIHENLRRLMAGRTTLIIAHRLSTIGLADRVVLLDRGRIVADGTHAELMASSPLYVEVLAQAAETEAEVAERESDAEIARGVR